MKKKFKGWYEIRNEQFTRQIPVLPSNFSSLDIPSNYAEIMYMLVVLKNIL